MKEPTRPWKLRRWFPFVPLSHVRIIEKDFNAINHIRFDLQGEVRALRGEIERLKEEAETARAHERTAYQMLVNVDFQMKYGFAPFPESPKLPESRVSTDNGGPVDAGYVHGRQLVNAGVAEARSAFDEYIKKATGDEDEATG